MATKRTGLGRGIGALIPTADDASRATRPVDVFFPDVDSTPATAIAAVEQAAATEGLLTVPGARLARVRPEDNVPNAPLAVQFHFGQNGGSVIYTSFHNESQSTQDMDLILSYMVFEL